MEHCAEENNGRLACDCFGKVNEATDEEITCRNGGEEPTDHVSVSLVWHTP